jgi:hypothetical protein
VVVPERAEPSPRTRPSGVFMLVDPCSITVLRP